MPRDKKEEEKPGTMLTEIVEAKVSSGSGSKERGLDDIFKERKQRLIRKQEMLEIERMIAEDESQLAQLKAQQQQPAATNVFGVPGMGPTGQVPQGTVAGTLFASLIAQGMTPEQVNNYLRALSPEAQAALANVANQNPMAAMMIGAMSRQNPQGLTVKDVVDILDKMAGYRQAAPETDMVKVIEAIGKLQQVGKPEGGSITELYTRVVQPLMESTYKAKVEAAQAQSAGTPGMGEIVT